MHFEKGKETMRRPHVIVYINYYMSTKFCPFCIVSDSRQLNKFSFMVFGCIMLKRSVIHDIGMQACDN